MNDYTYETFESEDGNFRARVVLDEHSYDMKPEDESSGTVLYQGTSHYRLDVETWAERHGSRETWESYYADLWRTLGDLDEIEKVLRGTHNVCESCERLLKFVEGEWIAEGALVDADLYCQWGDEEFCEPRYDFAANPVVGFDTVDLRDGRLINIVSLADLQEWGFESLAQYREQTGHEPTDGNLDAFEAWCNGDVYFVVVERKVFTETTIRDFAQNPIRTIQGVEWDELDSCYGFYSTETAEAHAKYTLDHFAKVGESA